MKLLFLCVALASALKNPIHGKSMLYANPAAKGAPVVFPNGKEPTREWHKKVAQPHKKVSASSMNSKWDSLGLFAPPMKTTCEP